MPTLEPYERQQRSTRIATYVLALVFYVLLYLAARFAFGTVVGLIVTSPVLGIYASVLLVNHAGDLRYMFRWLATRKVNGSQHVFDDQGVRINWRDGQCLVAAEDVYAVLGRKFDVQAARRTQVACGIDGLVEDEDGHWWFAEAALLQWLNPHAANADRRTIRFRLWLEREAFAPMHRKAELGHAAASP